MNKLLLLAGFLMASGMAFFVPATSHSIDATITKARVGVHATRTRVVLESTKPLKYKFFTLTNPDRVVLDLGDITFKTKLDSTEIHDNALISAMRQGTFKPRVVRMVLDAKVPVKASVFTIPSAKTAGARLVIDLYPISAKASKAPRKIVVKRPTKPKSARFTDRISKEQPPAPVVRKHQKGKKDPVVIVIDPGHGGIDPGAIGKHKTREKAVVLAIAKRLKTRLSRLPNTKVYMTRNKDVFIKLQDRVKFAQRRNADLFISLHADAHSDRRISGGSVYVLSEKSSDREGARLAKEADKSDIIAGVHLKKEPAEVRNILIDLTQRETLNKSAIFAQLVVNQLARKTKMRKKKAMFAGFKVLKAPEIPSILVELTYLSNPKEERKLKTGSHQNTLADAIASGTRTFIQKHIHK